MKGDLESEISKYLDEVSLPAWQATCLQDWYMKLIDKISKTNARSRKTPLTFGEFVAGVYQTWGKRRAKGIVHLAVKVQLVQFCGPERIVIV
jgi:hypothetical protein